MTSPRYHVWCLSWDDEEEYGSDVVEYDILKHYCARPERGVIYIPAIGFCGAAKAAEAYADHAHNNRDGYESTWPLVFRVRSPDGTIADFEVDREEVIEFSATPIKPVVKEGAA